MVKLLAVAAFGLVLAAQGCSPTVRVKHEVEPIFITVDVNIKIQKELEGFFDFEEQSETQGKN